jgi:hypothetical protein
MVTAAHLYHPHTHIRSKPYLARVRNITYTWLIQNQQEQDKHKFYKSCYFKHANRQIQLSEIPDSQVSICCGLVVSEISVDQKPHFNELRIKHRTVCEIDQTLFSQNPDLIEHKLYKWPGERYRLRWATHYWPWQFPICSKIINQV